MKLLVKIAGRGCGNKDADLSGEPSGAAPADGRSAGPAPTPARTTAVLGREL